MVPVIVILAAVCVSCVVSAFVTHRMLRGHREVIAALIARRALEVKDHVTSATGTASGDTAHRLGTLAETVESLADATRAVLMHKTVIENQRDPAAPKRV